MSEGEIIKGLWNEVFHTACFISRTADGARKKTRVCKTDSRKEDFIRQISVGYERRYVGPLIPHHMRCFTCQKYGPGMSAGRSTTCCDK